MINTENFLDVRRDIEAAVYTARALGYRTIVLHGHSLGNIQVQYYAANNWDPDIKAVVLSGMFANLPWKSRHMLVQNEESFAQLHEASLKSLREGKQTDVLPMQMRRTETRRARHRPAFSNLSRRPIQHCRWHILDPTYPAADSPVA